MSPPDDVDELDTRESEAREFRDEQLRWNDSFEGGWERKPPIWPGCHYTRGLDRE